MGITTDMKAISCLVLIILACLSHKAHADTLCMRECPNQCMKHNTEAQDIECYFFCVINCEKCPNSPTGCPPDEETTKRLAEADMNGMEQILIKAQTQGTRKLKN